MKKYYNPQPDAITRYANKRWSRKVIAEYDTDFPVLSQVDGNVVLAFYPDDGKHIYNVAISPQLMGQMIDFYNETKEDLTNE